MKTCQIFLISLIALAALTPVPLPAAATPRHPSELVLPPLRFEMPELDQHTLDCGIKVHGLENHDLPLVTIAIGFPMGYRYVPVTDFAAFDLMPDTWRSGGTQQLAPIALDERIAALDATIDVGMSGHSGHVTASCVREDLEGVLRLWRDLVVAPRFDTERLERARANELQSLLSLNDEPGRIASLRLEWMARGREYPGSWNKTRAELESVTADDLRRLHGRFVHPENVIIGVSGDYDPGELHRLLDQLFGDWKGAADFEPPSPDLWTAQPEPGVYVVPGDFEQSHLAIGYHIPELSKLSADYAGARILDFAVGYGRIFYRSRQEGLSYGSSLFLHVGADDALLEAVGSCRPEATVDLASMLVDELRGMRSRPVTREELDTSRTFRLGMVISESEVPRRLISTQLADLAEGRPADFQGDYLRGLLECTPEDLQGIVERYLIPLEEMVVMVVGDPSRFERSLTELGLGDVVELEPIAFGE
jgi:zinc protease